MTSEQTWKVSPYVSGDKAGILALNQIQYGDVALSHESYFDWLFGQNPAGEPIIPVARENGTSQVVGFAMFVPMRVVHGGKTSRALLGANLLVDRNYRRQGMSNVIENTGSDIARSERGYGFFYTFPNTNSLPGTVKRGSRVVARIPLLIRPLDIDSLAKTHISHPVVQWFVRIGWNLASNLVWPERKPGDGRTPVTVVPITEFDSSYDGLWDEVKTKYDTMLIRDRAFLNWRFVEIPDRSYHILSARQDGKLLGYVVLRYADIRGERVGLVVDMMVVPGQLGDLAGSYLMANALLYFRQAGLFLSGGLLLPHSHEYSILRRAGFVPCPERFAPQPFHLIEKSLSDDVANAELERGQPLVHFDGGS